MEDKPIEYVVNISTGEAIMTDRTKNLVFHKIVKWNPDHDCFTFEDKYEYILKDDYIDNLIGMMKSDLKVDSAFDNILKEKKIRKQKISNELWEFNVSGKNSSSSKKEKYHYTIITDNFLLKFYDKYYEFYHNINGNFIKYKVVENSKVYLILKTYIKDFFEKSIINIFNDGRVGTVKEGKLFVKILDYYKDDKGFVIDKMIIRCKTGPTCVIQSNLMSRFYYFYRGRQNPETQKHIKFPINGFIYMVNYLDNKLKEKKVKWK